MWIVLDDHELAEGKPRFSFSNDSRYIALVAPATARAAITYGGSTSQTEPRDARPNFQTKTGIDFPEPVTR
jgi:hypothetical protein